MSQKRHEQRRQLLQAAYDLVPEVGVKGLRTREITARAQLHLSSFHYCFESKEVFLSGLYRFIVDQFDAERMHYLETGTSPKEKLERRLKLIAYLMREKPVALRTLRTFFSEGWVDETVRGIVQAHYAAQRAQIAGWIAEGQADGTFSDMPTADPTIIASLLISLSDGFIFQLTFDCDAFSATDYTGAVLSWMGLRNDTSVNDILIPEPAGRG